MTHKESETIEFKKSTAELKEAVISIVAMLNKHGQGEVYFGISDDGKVVGQDIGRMTIKEVTQAVVDNIEPKIYPKVETRKIEGKDCVVVEAHGINSPYFAYGRAYIRVGESNKALSPHKIETLILSRKKLLWESEISERQLKDADVQTLKDYMKRANEEGRINFKYSNVKTTLRKLHLLSGEKLLKAAEVLFCNDNSMEIQAAIFAGTDKPRRIFRSISDGAPIYRKAAGKRFRKSRSGRFPKLSAIRFATGITRIPRAMKSQSSKTGLMFIIPVLSRMS